MKLNQNAKNMAAAMALVGAIIVALNAVVAPAGGRDMFPLSLGLLAVAVLFWIWIRRDALAPSSDDAAQAAEEAAAEAEALAKRREVRRDVQPAASVEPDDLTKIKGIAAGYQRILNDAGIRTYAALAAKSADELREIFSAANRAAPANLESLPMQAELAAKGDWEGLAAFQDSI
ncbi:MAG: hypothetical protein OXG53_05130 [Chloroflexi bacterium]|nr:hypothetical protein [Chloroflexota bacterium]